MQRDTGSIARSRRPGTQSIILAAGIVFAVLLTITSNLLLVRSQADSTVLAQALRVEARVSELQILLHRSEASQTRYLLAGDPGDAATLRETAEAAMPALSDLQTIVAGDPPGLAALQDLEPKIRDSVEELRETVRRHDAGDHAGALALVEHGPARELTREIHATLDRLVRDQRRSAELRGSDSAKLTFWLVAVRRLSVVALIALLIASIIIMRHVIREREVALQSLEIVNAGLEYTIAERTAEIRRTAEVLETAISSMAPAVIVIDIDLKVVLANPAAGRVLGISAGTEFAEWSKSYRVFFPDGVTPIPHEQRIMVRALRGEPTNNMEVFVRRVDAVRGFHLIANARPLRDSTGAVTGAVLVYQDVTETRQIEHQLRQAQKLEAVGQLTGGVAHDFNNILTVITGTIGILANGLAHDPLLSSIVRMIDEAADRGAELTRRLVAFARKQPLQPRATDVNALVLDSAKLLAPTLGEQIAIETVLCHDTWPALVDTSQLSSALINLALNARDAMPAGGRLTLETGNVTLDGSNVPPGPYVMIAVHDTGTGIPAAIRDKVFEPFFTTKDVGKGTGLGLSMVYGFVKQSGGHIEIDGEEGRGASIRLYLPRAVEADVASAATPLAPIEGGDETILVVEDDPPVRVAAISQLESLGYTTLAAEDAAAALAIIDRGVHLDLLFTDVIMPGGTNGRDLALAAMKRRPGLKVLFTSGYSEDAIVHRGRLDADVLLLAKPYRKSDLARMVRVALGGEKSAAAGAAA